MSRQTAFLLVCTASLCLAVPAAAQEPAEHCTATHDYRRIYAFQDYQYFKPPIADVRSPKFSARAYRDEALPFTSSTADGDHRFFDVSLGEHFPVLGANFYRDPPENCMEVRGLALALEASAHTLIDLDTRSSDVVNTDFRVGAALVIRPLTHWSLLWRFFHESTHLGDEFTLGAVVDSTFIRYNVSYEAHEALLAYDRYSPDQVTSIVPVYGRIYGGGRRYVQGFAKDWDGTFPAFEPDKPPLRLASLWEAQGGLEVFWRLFPDDDHPARVRDSFLDHMVKPQLLYLAGDVANRSRYATTAPVRTPWVHLAAGLVYGDFFQAERSVRWTLDFYDGPQPHGQFRSGDIRYWAVSFAIDF
ncbi:MAG: DUF1207 domain-containing protein [Gemmatimonadota bacterium]